MFTGIIESIGAIEHIESRAQGTTRIAIGAPELAHRLRVGDSIAVNGTCLTALAIETPILHADLAAETLARTTLGGLTAGSEVNLELPTPAGAPLGGHVVQGHVDGRGQLASFDPVNANVPAEQTDWWLTILLPHEVREFMVQKGSIAIEGISLTIASWDGESIGIAVLPHTRSSTNLRKLRPGTAVNVEADVMIKLALERQKQYSPRFVLTLAHMLANGY
jgi:riboflavin synthase